MKQIDWLRGVPGSYRRATAGIGRLARAGLPFFDGVTCVHPRNLEELPRVRAVLAELGVTDWRLFSIFPRGRAREASELRLSPEGLRQAAPLSRQLLALVG